jgi:hypothetical protein
VRIGGPHTVQDVRNREVLDHVGSRAAISQLLSELLRIKRCCIIEYTVPNVSKNTVASRTLQITPCQIPEDGNFNFQDRENFK